MSKSLTCQVLVHLPAKVFWHGCSSVGSGSSFHWRLHWHATINFILVADSGFTRTYRHQVKPEIAICIVASHLPWGSAFTVGGGRRNGGLRARGPNHPQCSGSLQPARSNRTGFYCTSSQTSLLLNKTCNKAPSQKRWTK